MKHTPWKTALGTALSAALIAAPLAAVPANAAEVSPAAAGTSPVVINEAYLSGGSAGAAFKNKFVELYNTSDAPVSLEGWSLQYRSATGTGGAELGGCPDRQHPRQGLLPAQGRQQRHGRRRTCPAADATATGFNPAGGGGTIVLAKQATALNPLPTGSVIEPANVADLLGYGTSNTFETQAATAPSGNTDVKSLNRSNGADTNNNSADFTLNASHHADRPPVALPRPRGPARGSAVTRALPRPPRPSPKSRAPAPQARWQDPRSPRAAGSPRRSPPAASPATTSRPPARAAISPRPTTRRRTLCSSTRPSTVDSVRIGDYVEVTGAVSEFFGMTQLNVAAAADLKKLTEAAPEVKATGFALPADEAFRESLEGMLLTPQGPVTVADNFSLNQYGEIGLAGGTTAAGAAHRRRALRFRGVHRHRRGQRRPRHQARRRRHHQLPQGRHHQGPGAPVPDHGGPRPGRRAGDVQDQRGAQLRATTPGSSSR